MPNLPLDGFPMPGNFGLSSNDETFGILSSQLLTGGYQEISSIEERNQIPIETSPSGGVKISPDGLASGRRRVGMIVFVVSEQKYYRLLPKGYFGNGGNGNLEQWNSLPADDKAKLLDPQANYVYGFPEITVTGTNVATDCWVEGIIDSNEPALQDLVLNEGAVGPQGPQGPSGEAGDFGPKGQKGEPGACHVALFDANLPVDEGSFCIATQDIDNNLVALNGFINTQAVNNEYLLVVRPGNTLASILAASADDSWLITVVGGFRQSPTGSAAQGTVVHLQPLSNTWDVIIHDGDVYLAMRVLPVENSSGMESNYWYLSDDTGLTFCKVSQGSQGEKGDPGDTGGQGPQGDDGGVGPKGNKGDNQACKTSEYNTGLIAGHALGLENVFNTLDGGVGGTSELDATKVDTIAFSHASDLGQLVPLTTDNVPLAQRMLITIHGNFSNGSNAIYNGLLFKVSGPAAEDFNNSYWYYPDFTLQSPTGSYSDYVRFIEGEEYTVCVAFEGADGPVGPQGTQGTQGAQGAQGEVGPVATIKGSTGEGGSVPTSGTFDEGDVFYVGSRAYQYNGSSWVDTNADLFSPQGPTGNDGTSVSIAGSYSGATSNSPSAAIGVDGSTATTGDGWINESDGYLWVWDGAAWTRTGEIRGPEGPVGPVGAQGAGGPQGAQGADGSAGAQGAQGGVGPVAVVRGSTSSTGSVPTSGTYDPGDIFYVGPRAYQYDGSVWVDTTADLFSPQGPIGPEGAQGADGPVGPQGAQGADGPVGPQGSQGAVGPPVAFVGSDDEGGTTPTAPTSPQGYTYNAGDIFYVGTKAYQYDGSVWNDTNTTIIAPQGAAGPGGEDGADGADGAQGPAGPQGAQGAGGAQGAQGDIGPVAPIKGSTGEGGSVPTSGTYDPGDVFYVGPRAYQYDGSVWVDTTADLFSPQGPIGPEGAQGASGNDGAQGPDGPQGAQGPDGPIGPQGSQGAVGPPAAFVGSDDEGGTTPTAPTSPQGYTYNAGDIFYVGTKAYQYDGSVWNDTNTTIIAPQGPTGNDGTSVSIAGSYSGATSDSPSVAIGVDGSTATTGDGWINDSDGYLWVWDGSIWTRTGEIRGPEGPVGPAGAQGAGGPQGAQGADGSAGAQGAQGAVGPVAVVRGSTSSTGSVPTSGTFDEGDVFYVGPRAYQYDGSSWIDTTADLFSPQGPAGPGGEDGADGADGAQGPAGPQGAQGAGGAVGAQGAQGGVGPVAVVRGSTGEGGSVPTSGTYDPGDIFYVGPRAYQYDGSVWVDTTADLFSPQGPIGPEGAQGADGNDGATGPQGAQGADGPVGPQGSQGAVGPPVAFVGSDDEGGTTPTAPTSPQGYTYNTGDIFYVGTKAYQYDGSVWNDTNTTIIAPQGPAGETGATGGTGGTGPNASIDQLQATTSATLSSDGVASGEFAIVAETGAYSNKGAFNIGDDIRLLVPFGSTIASLLPSGPGVGLRGVQINVVGNFDVNGTASTVSITLGFTSDSSAVAPALFTGAGSRANMSYTLRVLSASTNAPDIQITDGTYYTISRNAVGYEADRNVIQVGCAKFTYDRGSDSYDSNGSTHIWKRINISATDSTQDYNGVSATGFDADNGTLDDVTKLRISKKGYGENDLGESDFTMTTPLTITQEQYALGGWIVLTGKEGAVTFETTFAIDNTTPWSTVNQSNVDGNGTTWDWYEWDVTYSSGDTGIWWNLQGGGPTMTACYFIKGEQGPQGDHGAQGAQGDHGAQGAQGETGHTGPVADFVGSTGSGGTTPAGGGYNKGDVYLVGGRAYQYDGTAWQDTNTDIVGEKGSRGEIGPDGVKGEVGLRGETGPQGDLGPTGNDGTSVSIAGSYSGATTDSPSAAIGVDGSTATTGDGWINESDGYLWVWDGAAWTRTGEIRGPKGNAGKKGDTGQQGQKGEIGPDGKSGIFRFNIDTNETSTTTITSGEFRVLNDGINNGLALANSLNLIISTTDILGASSGNFISELNVGAKIKFTSLQGASSFYIVEVTRAPISGNGLLTIEVNGLYRGGAAPSDGTGFDIIVLDKGTKGEKGIKGIIGPQGERGHLPVIRGEVSDTGSFPASPSIGDIYLINGVTYTWDGSSWIPGASLQGDDGIKGEKGIKGDQGIKGEPAADLGLRSADGTTTIEYTRGNFLSGQTFVASVDGEYDMYTTYNTDPLASGLIRTDQGAAVKMIVFDDVAGYTNSTGTAVMDKYWTTRNAPFILSLTQDGMYAEFLVKKVHKNVTFVQGVQKNDYRLDVQHLYSTGPVSQTEPVAISYMSINPTHKVASVYDNLGISISPGGPRNLTTVELPTIMFGDTDLADYVTAWQVTYDFIVDPGANVPANSFVVYDSWMSPDNGSYYFRSSLNTSTLHTPANASGSNLRDSVSLSFMINDSSIVPGDTLELNVAFKVMNSFGQTIDVDITSVSSVHMTVTPLSYHEWVSDETTGFNLVQGVAETGVPLTSIADAVTPQT